MSKIRIDVLGPFRVRGPDGRDIRIPSGKLTYLLKLLVYAEAGLPREQILQALWPDAPEKSAQRSFRQALSSIRGLLGSDPFPDTTWVALDRSICTSDTWEMIELFTELDHRSGIGLVRGPLSHTEPISSPRGVQHAWERWYDATLRRLHSAVLAEARQALKEGDTARVESALAQGVRAGISEVALRRDVRGSDTAGLGWADRRVGVDALQSIVFRARRGLRSACTLVMESEPGWTLRSIESALADLPDRTAPSLISLPEQRQLGHLLAALLKLRGGAGVDSATDKLSRRLLDDLPFDLDSEGPQLSVMNALADALDEATHEQAIVVVVSATELHQSTATLLARAIARYGGDGVTLLLVGEEEKVFRRPPVTTLQAAFESVDHIIQIDPDVAGVHDKDAALMPGGGHAPWSTHAIWAAASLALVAITGLLSTRLSGPAPLPTLSEDIVFCSARGGAPQYYRWGQTFGVERISADTAVFIRLGEDQVCGGRLVNTADGDSVLLSVISDGRIEWRRYPNVRTRGNLVGTPLPLNDPTGQTISHGGRTLIVLSAEEGEWTLFDPLRATTLTASIPAGDRLRAVGESGWLVEGPNDRGIMGTKVIDPQTGAIIFETNSLIDEMQGSWFDGDQILLARGPQGDEEDGSLELIVVDPATGSEEILTRNDWNDYELTVSPDGMHVCWQSEEQGHFASDVRVMRTRGRMILPQEDEPGRQNGCHFSGDGSFVIYYSDTFGDREVVARSLADGVPVRISRLPGAEQFVGTLPIR